MRKPKIDTPNTRKTVMAVLAEGVPATAFYLGQKCGFTSKQMRTCLRKMVKDGLITSYKKESDLWALAA